MIRPGRLVLTAAVLAVLALVKALGVPGRLPPVAAAPTRPNIVVVMTDDQDLASVARMPNVQRLLAAQGVTFSRHTVSFSICCPSRATYLSGQYSHNNGVHGNSGPDGGYGALDTTQTLPVWLSRAGYVTNHLGKYPNGYDGSQHREALGVPPGWTEWNGAVDPTTYRFYEYVLNENGRNTPHGRLPDEYQTDVLTAKAVDFVERRAPGESPFFLDVAYLAPHWEFRPGSALDSVNPGDLEGQFNDESMIGTPPIPAPRHAAAFANVKAPRPPSFNEADVSDKPAYVRDRPPLSDAYIDKIDRWYRFRVQSLQAVDEGVGAIVNALERSGELDETYFVFTADNGWQQGEHRIGLKKVDAYDSSTRIPLIVRGPGARAGGVVSDWTSNVDLQSTILDLANADRPGATFELDGMSLSPYLTEPSLRPGRVVLHEVYEGSGQPYTAVRAGRWKWVEYASGDRELYDLLADPHELTSRHAEDATADVRSDLEKLLTQMRTCEGSACVVTGYTDVWNAPDD